MQIIIDIPEEQYKFIKQSMTIDKVKDYPALLDDICEHIAGGVLLQKGHGRLIDEKEIDTVVNGIFNVFDTYSPETFLNVIHNQCVEAVGIDKAESEGEE